MQRNIFVTEPFSEFKVSADLPDKFAGFHVNGRSHRCKGFTAYEGTACGLYDHHHLIGF